MGKEVLDVDEDEEDEEWEGEGEVGRVEGLGGGDWAWGGVGAEVDAVLVMVFDAVALPLLTPRQLVSTAVIRNGGLNPWMLNWSGSALEMESRYCPPGTLT